MCARLSMMLNSAMPLELLRICSMMLALHSAAPALCVGAVVAVWSARRP